MPKAPKQLLKDALQLPEDQRAGLAADLLDSLEPAVPSEGRSEAEWIAEVQRRAHAAVAGQPGIPWDQALAQVTDRLPHK
jgi:putative addiction module component (TIGR02574 family)